jgi:hypothetical protein
MVVLLTRSDSIEVAHELAREVTFDARKQALALEIGRAKGERAQAPLIAGERTEDETGLEHSQAAEKYDFLRELAASQMIHWIFLSRWGRVGESMRTHPGRTSRAAKSDVKSFDRFRQNFLAISASAPLAPPLLSFWLQSSI